MIEISQYLFYRLCQTFNNYNKQKNIIIKQKNISIKHNNYNKLIK